MKEFIEITRNYLGNKFVSGITLIVLGATLWYLANSYFITCKTFAAEKEKISKWIQIGDGTQQMQVLYLRKDLIKARVEEAEDKIENNPDSHKWKERLKDRQTEFRTINDEIEKLNKELRNE